MMIDISPAPAPSSRTRGLPGAASAVLTVAAALGALSLVAALVFAVAGVTPLIFTSGSMSPEIPTGSLALARTTPVGDLAVGDVVSVPDAVGTRVTHRVVAIDPRGLTLKGDANLSADSDTYAVADADKVLVSVPYAGTALSAVTGPRGRGALVLLAAMVLLSLVWPRAGVRLARAERVAVLAALTVVIGVGAGVARAPEGTSAFWADSVAATSTVSVAVPVLPQLTGTSCQTSSGKDVRLRWADVPADDDFLVEALRSGQVVDSVTRDDSAPHVEISGSANGGGAQLFLPDGTYAIRVTARDNGVAYRSSTFTITVFNGAREVRCGT